MKSKVALFLTGRISDNFEFTYKNILETFQNCSIDFFVMHCCKDEIFVNKMKEIYKPKICDTTFIDDYSILNDIHVVIGKHKVRIFNVLNMFNNRYKLFNLFEKYCLKNKLKYDYIINYRFDLYSISIIDINDIIEIDKLHVPYIANSIGINDQVAIGNIKIMKQYYSLFDYFRKKKINCMFHPETMLKYHIDNLNIELRKFNFMYLISRNNLKTVSYHEYKSLNKKLFIDLKIISKVISIILIIKIFINIILLLILD
jgi:hypothetical protein